MTRNSRFLTAAVGLIGALAFAGAANAGPIGVTNANVSIWHFTNAGPGTINDACEQALANNPCATGPNNVYNGLYTGLINFSDPSGGVNTIAAFLNSAGGTFVLPVGGLTQQLSSGGFSVSTLMEFTFTIGARSIRLHFPR